MNKSSKSYMSILCLVLLVELGAYLLEKLADTVVVFSAGLLYHLGSDHLSELMRFLKVHFCLISEIAFISNYGYNEVGDVGVLP